MAIIFYIFFALIISGLLAIGFYCFSLYLPGVASKKTSKTINALLKNHISVSAKNDYNSDIIMFISKFIRLNPYKRQKLVLNLKTANIQTSPESYYANAVLQFFKYSLLVVPFLFLLPVLSFLPLILAFLQFLKEVKKAEKHIREKRKQIELDLPRLVYAISHELKGSHDVLTILERHKDGLSPQFMEEINITIADMRTGNYESALLRFEGRIGSTQLSEVVRGFIEMINGNDTHIYWETLAFKLSEFQKQNLRKEANKIPAKVRRLSFCLLIAIVLTYGMVLGMQLVNNIGILF